MMRSLAGHVSAALCATLILSGCGASSSGDVGESLAEVSESPTPATSSPEPEYTDAPLWPPPESATPTPTVEAPLTPAEAPIQSFGRLPDAALVQFETCSSPEDAIDFIGNEFTVTVCAAPGGEAVSFYEFDPSQYPGMASEYTDVAHMASNWGVAARTQATLQTIVSNLDAAGF